MLPSERAAAERAALEQEHLGARARERVGRAEPDHTSSDDRDLHRPRSGPAEDVAAARQHAVQLVARGQGRRVTDRRDGDRAAGVGAPQRVGQARAVEQRVQIAGGEGVARTDDVHR